MSPPSDNGSNSIHASHNPSSRRRPHTRALYSLPAVLKTDLSSRKRTTAIVVSLASVVPWFRRQAMGDGLRDWRLEAGDLRLATGDGDSHNGGVPVSTEVWDRGMHAELPLAR